MGLGLRNLCSEPLEWEVFCCLWLCHLDFLSGILQLFPRRCCGSVTATWQVTMGTQDVAGAETSPPLFSFFNPMFCKSQTLPCLSRANSFFFPFCFITLNGCFQSGLLPHFPAGISGSSHPHASLNSHAFGQLLSCSQFVPLSWFSSKFGLFGGARMGSIDFGFNCVYTTNIIQPRASVTFT